MFIHTYVYNTDISSVQHLNFYFRIYLMSTEKDKYSLPLWFSHVADTIVITLPVLSEPNYNDGENSIYLCLIIIKTNYKWNLFKKCVSLAGHRRQRKLSRIWKYNRIITMYMLCVGVHFTKAYAIVYFLPCLQRHNAVHCHRTVMSTASHPPATLLLHCSHWKNITLH